MLPTKQSLSHTVTPSSPLGTHSGDTHSRGHGNDYTHDRQHRNPNMHSHSLEYTHSCTQPGGSPVLNASLRPTHDPVQGHTAIWTVT